MKLNLGCGDKKLPGFVNCDSQAACNPDRLVDLEALPWPFDDNCADEIVLSHVLEHLGESCRVYLGIIKELYRVCAPDAIVRIAVPHPRHDDFLTDPTHVRPILPDQFYLFSKKANAEWRAGGYANTPLAVYLDVDFQVEDVEWVVDDIWMARLQQGEITKDDLTIAARHQNNVLKEARIKLRVNKG
jgi:predicted SAM-dependent methyltransferase